MRWMVVVICRRCVSSSPKRYNDGSGIVLHFIILASHWPSVVHASTSYQSIIDRSDRGIPSGPRPCSESWAGAGGRRPAERSPISHRLHAQHATRTTARSTTTFGSASMRVRIVGTGLRTREHARIVFGRSRWSTWPTRLIGTEGSSRSRCCASPRRPLLSKYSTGSQRIGGGCLLMSCFLPQTARGASVRDHGHHGFHGRWSCCTLLRVL